MTDVERHGSIRTQWRNFASRMFRDQSDADNLWTLMAYVVVNRSIARRQSLVDVPVVQERLHSALVDPWIWHLDDPLSKDPWTFLQTFPWTQFSGPSISRPRNLLRQEEGGSIEAPTPPESPPQPPDSADSLHALRARVRPAALDALAAVDGPRVTLQAPRLQYRQAPYARNYPGFSQVNIGGCMNWIYVSHGSELHCGYRNQTFRATRSETSSVARWEELPIIPKMPEEGGSIEAPTPPASSPSFGSIEAPLAPAPSQPPDSGADSAQQPSPSAD